MERKYANKQNKYNKLKHELYKCVWKSTRLFLEVRAFFGKYAPFCASLQRDVTTLFFVNTPNRLCEEKSASNRSPVLPRDSGIAEQNALMRGDASCWCSRIVRRYRSPEVPTAMPGAQCL